MNGKESSIPTLIQESGMRLFLCNEFTRGYSSGVAHSFNMQPIDVYNEIVAHLVPNAMLTPTGVWAIHAVQEHKFTLLPVTVREA
jgi:hypothetical protein